MDLILFFATQVELSGDKHIGRDHTGVMGSPAGVSHQILVGHTESWVTQVCWNLGKQGLECGGVRGLSSEGLAMPGNELLATDTG